MPRLTQKLPSYRLHKPSGKAVVTINGRDHYLGDFGTPESRAEYDRLIAEYLANRRMRSAINLAVDAGSLGSSDLTINEMLLAFWRHAERHYRTPSGAPSKGRSDKRGRGEGQTLRINLMFIYANRPRRGILRELPGGRSEIQRRKVTRLSAVMKSTDLPGIGGDRSSRVASDCLRLNRA
jgi:hypothetical protein